MNVLFVCGTHLDCNSGIHVFNLANHLAAMGHRCTVAVAERPEATRALGQANFATVAWDDLDSLDDIAPGDDPIVVHAWTPRENVRRTVERLQRLRACPYVVHLEDNEEYLTRSRLGTSADRRDSMPIALPDEHIPDHASHPARYKTFLAGASGVTALVDELVAFKPRGIPACVFWPGFDPHRDWMAPSCPTARRRAGIRSGEHVVVYCGNVHHANRTEVASLYIAIGLLNRRGIRVRLVRTGNDTAPIFDGPGEEVLAPYVTTLGFVDREDIPAILGLADVVVQPGAPGCFNDFRFPSKLPECFASGRPVLLPHANLGRYVVDDVHACVMRKGDAFEIADILQSLLRDDVRRKRLGAAARAFALKHFDWSRHARRVARLYLEAIEFAANRPAAQRQSA